VGRYQFTHALIRATLYEELTGTRRVRLHRRIGEVLEEVYGADLEPHLARLAHHFFEGDGRDSEEKAIIYCLAMKATFVGHFAEGERLALEALATGQRLRGHEALGLFSVQMFTLRREQGRLQELASVVRSFVQRHPATSTWRPGLALIYCELGLATEARAEFESLAAKDFAGIPRDARWLMCIVYLAEVCAFLGDTDRAPMLYDFLTPHDGFNLVVGPSAACFGAAARYLGLLAATMVRWDDAQRHFENALAMNARMGAKPGLAHTQREFAAMLLKN
jgi:tetratricopeptide (TPR) repeat protein